MAEKYYALVGNCKMSSGTPLGMTVLEYAPDSGKMSLVGNFEQELKVGAQWFDPGRSCVYVVDEFWNQPGRTGGGGHVAGLALDRATGALHRKTLRRTFASNPSYVSQDKTGRYLLVSHHCTDRFVTRMVRTENGYNTVTEYDLCTLLLFRLEPDGNIGALADIFQVPGHDDRGEHAFPHLHCVVPDPRSGFFIVCDKGLDKVYSFTIDYVHERLVKVDELDCPQNSEPRYCSFHPEKPVFYFNGEGSGQLHACGLDRGTGKLYLLGSSDLTHGENVPDIWPCDVKTHPNGKLVFSSIRRRNLISVHRVGANGMPVLYQVVDCGGRNPRGLCVSPDGALLLCANTESHSITEFAIGVDGSLTLLRSIDVGGCPGNIQIIAV